MNPATTAVIHDCAARSLQGAITFPEVVRTLADAGVERYHADYTRHEITYYLPDGHSLVVPYTCPQHPIDQTFSPDAVEAAIRQSQRGEHLYADFLRKTMAAGCVGYFVQITGRRALYFGRNGETHLEPFPT